MLGRIRFLCWGVDCIRKSSVILCIKSLSARVNRLLKSENTKMHFHFLRISMKNWNNKKKHVLYIFYFLPTYVCGHGI